MVSSTLGSPTNTCWKRRSSAESVSMNSRYSLSVVAPMSRSSPRASIGLSILDALTLDSPPPAPMSVCSSSMKVMISPSASVISFSTAFIRSSNSPRYFAPARMAERSSEMSRLFLSDSGTSPATIRWARPSTTAVLPTPGSPMSTGLFLVRRVSTWLTRRISASRPITGSSLPDRATSVRSIPNCSSALLLCSSGACTPCILAMLVSFHWPSVQIDLSTSACIQTLSRSDSSLDLSTTCGNFPSAITANTQVHRNSRTETRPESNKTLLSRVLLRNPLTRDA